MARCPHCNSDHGPDEYAVGYFIVDGQVRSLEGEETVLAYGREEKLQIYWTPEAANDALRRLNGENDTDPVTGELR